MPSKSIKILAIETSCDETAAAIICGANYSKKQDTRDKIQNIKMPVILSNVISSQIDLHAKTGGVVPEVASRAHMEAMIPVISEALIQSQTSNLKPQNYGIKSYSNKSRRFGNVGIPIEVSGLTSYNLTPDLLSQITHIAVTAGPGLIGSLLVGFNTAKAIAYSLNLPIIPINHIEGHIYSAIDGVNSKFEYRNPKQILNSNDQNSKYVSDFGFSASDLLMSRFPILALTVSGGHTSLTLMHDHGKYQTIGQTRDDAAGEAFDKVAKMLDLGYPGGPVVSKLAEEFRKTNNLKLMTNNYGKNHCYISKMPNQVNLASEANKAIVLPRPMIKDKNFDFSFSGLKTAVLEVVKQVENQNVIASETKQSNSKKIAAAKNGLAMTEKKELYPKQKQEICAAFEDAAVDVLVTKTLRAVEKYQPKSVILAGGVAANKRLREELTSRLKDIKIQDTRYKQVSNYKSQIPSDLDSEKSKKLIPNSYNLILPPAELCGDNAAMIGLAAYYHIIRGDVSTWDEVKIDNNLEL